MKFLLALVLAVLPALTRAAVTFDARALTNNSSAYCFLSQTVATQAHRIYLLQVNIQSASVSVTAVSFGGSSMIQLTRHASNVGFSDEVWYQVNPVLGVQAANVTISTATLSYYTGLTYYDVNTVSPFGASSSAILSTGSGAYSVTVTTASANSALLGLLSINNNPTTTLGASLTLRANNTSFMNWSDKPTTTAGAYNLWWSTSVNARRNYTVYELKPAYLSGFLMLMGIGQ